MRPWMLILPFFAGCPWEWRCVTTEPRPSPASLAQLNEELVSGLSRCGFVGAGRRGVVTLVRLEPAPQGAAMDCARACIRELREDCEALAQMACLEVVPDALSACVRDCARNGCRHAGPGSCAAPSVRCGIGLEGLAPLSMELDPARSFACADGSGAITPQHVCDFVEDCPDGSDEAAALGCARLSCAGAAEEITGE